MAFRPLPSNFESFQGQTRVPGRYGGDNGYEEGNETPEYEAWGKRVLGAGGTVNAPSSVGFLNGIAYSNQGQNRHLAEQEGDSPSTSYTYTPYADDFFEQNYPFMPAADVAAAKAQSYRDEGGNLWIPNNFAQRVFYESPYQNKDSWLDKLFAAGPMIASAAFLGPLAFEGLAGALSGAGALSATEAATLFELTGLPEYAAATGAGLGTAAEVVNDGTWMEDLLGPPQSPAPPSSLMQQLVDAGVPFDLAKYLPSEASLVKTLIQQGLKLANSDGSGSSSTARPQAGGLPNYSGGSTNSGGGSSYGGSTNSGGDSYSGGVSGSFGNPFPDAPTGGANPIKAYLQPTGVSTGAPSQSTMYAGLDPKLVNILSQRAAHGGQIHPRLQQVLSDRGYEINPVEMVAGPEDRYYARHAKRGFAVNGKGTGQSDDIPTMLADGEYVFDSDTVSALGDGSSKAGAAALDKMREEIRKHKRSAPVDKIPPKAKSPLDYMRTVKRVK